jgi:hypothetical protein
MARSVQAQLLNQLAVPTIGLLFKLQTVRTKPYLLFGAAQGEFTTLN